MRFSVKNAIQDCWRSTRLFATALLAVAVILGAHYRFDRLDRWGLNSDEGSAWAAATAPSLKAVIAAEPKVENGGKLPVYDLLLHEWIDVFGDTVSSMRRLSAVNGTIVIVLVFVAVREICRSLGDESSAATGELAGAFAALIYATNATMILSDRTAREFPLLLTTELLQIAFFVRAQRTGALADYLGAALSTAVMIPVNYSSSFLLFGEALWLGCLLAARWKGARAGRLAIFRPGLAVAAGVALLGPLLSAMVADSERAVQTGAIQWIKPQPIWWAFQALHDSANSPASFWIFVVLALFAVWRQWRSAPLVSGFLALWTAGPLLAIFAVSSLIRPMEFPRYVLIAFVGMFAFAAFGAASVRSTAARTLLAAALVYLSMPFVHGLRHWQMPAWGEAVRLASRQTAPGDQIAVYTPYNVSVVRYYLSADRRADAVGMSDKCGPARLLIIWQGGGASASDLAAAQACYPQVRAQLHQVKVRAR